MGEKIIGTPEDDHLVATAEDQTLFAMAGDDRLESAFNRTRLNGGLGNDALATALALEGTGPVTGKVWQSGGTGDNALGSEVVITTDEHRRHPRRSVHPGRGRHDHRGQPGGFRDGDATVRTRIWSGAGADVITATTSFPAEVRGYVFSENVITAGQGDDIVTADIGDAFMMPSHRHRTTGSTAGPATTRLPPTLVRSRMAAAAR